MTTRETQATVKTKLTRRLGLIFLVLAAVWLYAILTAEHLLPQGQAAPDWKLEVAGHPNKTLGLEELRGKAVVLDFWSLGCPPCLEEARVLETIHRQMENRGVTVVGVAAWGESPSDVQDFKKERNLTYPMLLGTKEMVDAYKVASLPTLYIIDKEGKIAASHQGFWSRDAIARAVTKVLAQ
jgi:peroxiredoxin